MQNVSRRFWKVLVPLRYLNSLVGDLWLSVNTRGSIYFDGARGIYRDAHDFETCSHSTIAKAIRHVEPGPRDVAFVLGCGKGRAVCHLARRNVRKVVGIEISPELADIARANARRLRGRRAPIEIRTGDAAAEDLSEGTVFYLFNPFGEHTLQSVLTTIQRTLGAIPIRMIYVGPQFFQVFKRFPWLKVVYDYRRLGGLRTLIYRSDSFDAREPGA